jgi:hypothetical protein
VFRRLDVDTRQEIRESITQASQNGKVPCKTLLDLAERTGTPPAEVGLVCNEMDIRICGCQLNCFP